MRAMVPLLVLAGCFDAHAPDGLPEAGLADAGPDCAPGEERTGCPCDDAVGAIVCHEGGEGTAGVGICEIGLRTCDWGIWGACEGQVLPVTELCNGEDDDCDGETDEGTLSPCGDCEPSCSVAVFGGDGLPFEVQTNACQLDGTGSLYPILEAPWQALWLVEPSVGTVALVNSATSVVVRRHRTGPGARADDPSRTTVFLDGNLVVANRGTDIPASVTLIRKTGCRDAPEPYSDFVQNFITDQLPPPCDHRIVLEADCPDGTRPSWRTVSVDVDLGPGSSASVQARGADTAGELAEADWTYIGRENNQSGVVEMDLAEELGQDASARVLEVGTNLYGSAVLRSVRIEHSCE